MSVYTIESARKTVTVVKNCNLYLKQKLSWQTPLFSENYVNYSTVTMETDSSYYMKAVLKQSNTFHNSKGKEGIWDCTRAKGISVTVGISK